MAISFNNQLTKNYHGRMGEVVFRVRGNASIMSVRPDCSNVIRTEKQLAINNNFAKSVKYAQFVIKNPELKAFYTRKKGDSRMSAYNAAMSDYLLSSKIERVDFGGYQGMPGNMITVEAWDKWKVESVGIVIYNEAGEILEAGAAVPRDISGALEWDYTATTQNVDYKTSRIHVKVSGLPKKITEGWFDVGGG